jgi:hypothetical protein
MHWSSIRENVLSLAIDRTASNAPGRSKEIKQKASFQEEPFRWPTELAVSARYADNLLYWWTVSIFLNHL